VFEVGRVWRWTPPLDADYDRREDQALPPRARHARPTLGIRGVLVAGFAVVFALWFISAFQLLRNVRLVEQDVATARARTERGEEILTTVRTNVLFVSVYLRDALIDPSPQARDNFRKQLVALRSDVERSLPQYAALVTTDDEKQRFAELQNALTQYWNVREGVFAEDLPKAPNEAIAVLQRLYSGMPTRDSILTIVNTLSELQQAAAAKQRAETTAFYEAAQTQIVMLAAIAMVTGLGVAFVAIRHVAQLQRQVERQRQAEQQNSRDLERLSARLVNAQEEERRSLARELHDAVGQALTAIKMEMGVALRGAGIDSRARTALDQARAIAESTLQSVRDLSQVLHPSMLDDFGVTEAVSAHLRTFSKRTGIRAQLIHERMNDRLPADIEICAYRIVQEALTNVARHSGASSCTVSLIRRDGLLHVTVEDDGKGIEKPVARTPDARRGLGLVGMRERAQALAGTFVIENRHEGGTRVVARLPVPSGEEVASNTEVSANEKLAG
jgi:signal transduction histidine kinase